VERRTQLQEKFDEDMDGMKENIDDFFDRAADGSYVSSKISKVSYQGFSCPPLTCHTSASRCLDFTARLMELFKKRGDIEAHIIRHSRVVEQAYCDANKELGEILTGKLEDIEGGPKTPNVGQSGHMQSS
jgi:hypothetical protein